MTIQEAFERSFQYYLENEDYFKLKYKNKVIAIYVDRVLGVYKNKLDAYLKVPKEHGIENGSFVITNPSEDKNRRVYSSILSF